MNVTVYRSTNTYADALEAIGTADLLQEIGFTGVHLRDTGQSFEITTTNELPPEGWPRCSPGFKYVWERRNEPEPPPWGYLDYERERAANEAWKSFEKGRKKAGKGQPAPDSEPPEKPSPELPLASILNSMRKGWNADRELAHWLDSNQDAARQWIRNRLAGDINPPETLPQFSNSQMLNPIGGKGVNSPKTVLRSPASVPDVLLDPFREWMKLRGMWGAMLAYRSDEDFKFFVIEPQDISFDAIAVVIATLRRLSLWGGLRLDIETTLRLTALLLDHSEVAQKRAAPLIALYRRRPRQIISGLRQAFFKSLGTAAALMNDALLPLPGWFVLETKEDVKDYMFIIEEMIGSFAEVPRTWGSLGSLDENKSDDGETLQQFRSWLLTGDLYDLLQFHRRFAIHTMQRLGAKEYVRAFSTKYLDTLLIRSYEGQYQMREIIENQGFQSIARAVRNTTVYALRLKNREVRFGLAQNWAQKLKSGDQEFAAAVATFVQQQNWEVQNRLGGKGHTVTATHLDEFLGLLEKHHSELVGSLLLAYGYSRAEAVGEASTEGPQEPVAASIAN